MQEIITIVICSLAGLAVARSLWTQVRSLIRASGSPDQEVDTPACSGCSSCAAHKASQQLISLSAASPMRIRPGAKAKNAHG